MNMLLTLAGAIFILALVILLAQNCIILLP